MDVQPVTDDSAPLVESAEASDAPLDGLGVDDCSAEPTALSRLPSNGLQDEPEAIDPDDVIGGPDLVEKVLDRLAEDEARDADRQMEALPKAPQPIPEWVEEWRRKKREEVAQDPATRASRGMRFFSKTGRVPKQIKGGMYVQMQVRTLGKMAEASFEQIHGRPPGLYEVLAMKGMTRCEVRAMLSERILAYEWATLTNEQREALFKSIASSQEQMMRMAQRAGLNETKSRGNLQSQLKEVMVLASEKQKTEKRERKLAKGVNGDREQAISAEHSLSVEEGDVVRLPIDPDGKEGSNHRK